MFVALTNNTMSLKLTGKIAELPNVKAVTPAQVQLNTDKGVEMMQASGARKVRVGLNYGAHAMGSCRMGADRKTSVVNEFCQSHDIANLFICDTSVFVTGSGVNPTLTAMAISSRAAEFIAESARRGDFGR